jgi:hypothetical protein
MTIHRTPLQQSFLLTRASLDWTTEVKIALRQSKAMLEFAGEIPSSDRFSRHLPGPSWAFKQHRYSESPTRRCLSTRSKRFLFHLKPIAG